MSPDPTPSPGNATANPGSGPTRRPPRWRGWRLLAALGLAALAVDLVRPPAAQLSARLLLGGIEAYQATLSPRLPGLGVSCRFSPTCSHYGHAVIARDGTLVGSARTAARIARCGPWTPAGTHDPP
jgi:uncharacterized protein